jgi:pilus assembly protein Flp/PilA
MLSILREVRDSSKERGASAVEYGLMVAAIAAVIVAIVFGLGTLVSNTFTGTCKTINQQATAAHQPVPGNNTSASGC